MLDLFLSALQQSLAFFPLALAVYISYRMAQLTDLAVEGAFVLGAGGFARLLSQGAPPILALAAALALGLAVGLAVAWIQRANHVSPLIAGILALFMLYSVNLCVMGRPNIGIYEQRSLLSPWLEQEGVFWSILGAIVFLSTFLLGCFMRSTRGLILRAWGNQPDLVGRMGHSVEGYRCLALGVSNTLAAFAGVWAVEVNRYADVHMGFGMALTAITTVLIGTHLNPLPRKQAFSAGRELTSVGIGVGAYFLAIQLCLYAGLNPLYLKLVLGLFLIFFLKTQHQKRPQLGVH